MKIFISYRRDDTAGYAGRLFDHLAAHFGAKNVFMDIDTIQPGEDFRKVVSNAVGTCDVVLVMIGKQWLRITDGQGRQRLEDPHDWVRVEVANALANSKTLVIPVLVREANMPGEQDLPADLKELSWRNAIELSDSRFQHDAGKLVEVIERASTKSGGNLLGGRHKRSARLSLGIILGLVALGLSAWMLRGIVQSKTAAETQTPAMIPTSANLPVATLAPTEAAASMATSALVVSETPVSPLEFFDNFDGGINPTIWQVNLKDWSGQRQGIAYAADIYKGAKMLIGDPSWQDYKMTVNTQSSTGKATSYFAIIYVHYQDQDNQVQFFFDCDYPSSSMGWRYKQYGNMTDVSVKELGVCKLEPYTIQLLVRGTKYEAVVDGEKVTFALDLFPNGMAGLFSGENGGAAAAAFDNFAIEP